MTPAEALASAINAWNDGAVNMGPADIRDVLAALAAAGFVVVPEVATEEMFAAMVERDGRPMKFRFHTFANQWRWMIELVPGVEPGSEEQLRQMLAARPR